METALFNYGSGFKIIEKKDLKSAFSKDFEELYNNNATNKTM